MYKSLVTTEIYINYIDGEYVPDHYLREIEILSEGLTIDKLKKGYDKLISHVTKKLKEHRVNVSALQRSAKNKGLVWQKKFRKAYEQGKDPKEFSSDLLSDFKFEIKNIINDIKSDLRSGDYVVGVIFFLAIFALMLFLNTALALVFMKVIAPNIAYYIVAAVIAPMIEEAAKNLAIQTGQPWVGTGIMFGAEFAMYIPRVLDAGFSITQAVIARAVGLAIHFFTTFIQKKIIDKGIEKGEDRRFVAWATGVAIHASVNSIAALGVLLGLSNPI